MTTPFLCRPAAATGDPIALKLEEARRVLRQKLLNVDLKAAGLSEYNQRYIRDKLGNIDATLELYCTLLKFCLENSKVPMEHVTLLDYGAGSGVLTFLAKAAGIGKVLYSDIYDVACDDARLLSAALNLPLEGIITGDVDEVITYVRAHSLSINVIVSYDVLEHIYNLDDHFRRLFTVNSSRFRVVYASSANIRNPRYVRSVKKKQLYAEYRTREKVWGHKERDALTAYFTLRKQIIANYAPDLTSSDVEFLASSTRGLIKSDIERCVDEFRRNGRMSYCPSHPTNTCDPFTGNWCEHLIPFHELQRIALDAGFESRVRPGYYPASGPLLKKAARRCLNVAIRALGTNGLVLAPYYVLIAKRKAAQI